VITPVVVAASTDTAQASNAVVTDSASTGSASTGTASTETPADPTAAKLMAVAKAWLEQNGVEGVQFGISKAGVVYQVGAAGSLGVDDTYDIWSVTKTLTTTLVLREVEAGNLDLDAPLKPLSAVPSFDASRFTVRELLSHTTGLVNYRDTPTYAADPNSIASPEAALTDADSQPLMFSPGTKSFYSSTNYLVLGFLLEDLTGKPFGQLLSESLLQPLGLDSAQVTPPMPGEPNFSTGGLVMDTADLLAWTSYYLRDHADLSPDIWSMMTKIDPASSLGTGLIGYCPCTDSASGDYQWKGLGYAGSTTLIQYSPSDDVAIVVNLSEPLWKTDFFGSVLGLFESFRAVADAAS
jgi:CubicO group peptidase (beta-lactamase class C family)